MPWHRRDFGPVMAALLAKGIAQTRARSNFRKKVIADSVLNKEGIEAETMSAYKAVALFFTQSTHGLQRSAAIIFRVANEF